MNNVVSDHRLGYPRHSRELAVQNASEQNDYAISSLSSPYRNSIPSRHDLSKIVRRSKQETASVLPWRTASQDRHDSRLEDRSTHLLSACGSCPPSSSCGTIVTRTP